MATPASSKGAGRAEPRSDLGTTPAISAKPLREATSPRSAWQPCVAVATPAPRGWCFPLEYLLLSFLPMSLQLCSTML